ncbi:MAG: sulfur oxidation c-type cytochrome SoxX [Rhizobacter sp.]|nr:sulfur oxidation c-type cytochrome SoxX [Rhizobacter sp.]
MMKTTTMLLAGLLAGCAMPAANDAKMDARFDAMLKTSFEAKGIATLDRLQQDETQKLCSDPVQAVSKEAAPMRAKLEKKNLETVKWPSNGKYLGDWKEGEKIAQSGRGMTWSDKADAANGGNCYNCHMIDKAEISFGTIGPSLWNYGKLRGVTDPTSAAAQPVVQYTWGKIWNAKAYNACSNMPRAGHMGILNESQIQDVMALLLDPKSPVNQ